MSSTYTLDNLASLGDSNRRNVSKGHIQMQISVSLFIQFIQCEVKVFTTSKVELDRFLADIERKGGVFLVFWNDFDEILKVQQSCLESIFCNLLCLLCHGIPRLWIFRVSYDHFPRKKSWFRRRRDDNIRPFFIQLENVIPEFQVFQFYNNWRVVRI